MIEPGSLFCADERKRRLGTSPVETSQLPGYDQTAVALTSYDFRPAIAKDALSPCFGLNNRPCFQPHEAHSRPSPTGLGIAAVELARMTRNR